MAGLKHTTERFECSGDGHFRASSGSRARGGALVVVSAVCVVLLAGGEAPAGSAALKGVLLGMALGAGIGAWLHAGVIRSIDVGPEGLVLREIGALGSRTRRVPAEAICGVRRGPWVVRGPRRAVHRVELLLEGERLPRTLRVFASPRMLLARRVCEEIARGLSFTERMRPAERVVELRRAVA